MVDARGAPTPLAKKPSVLVVADPGPGDNRPDAEPDETGWSAKHEGAFEVVVVAVPMVWHMIVEEGQVLL